MFSEDPSGSLGGGNPQKRKIDMKTVLIVTLLEFKIIFGAHSTRFSVIQVRLKYMKRIACSRSGILFAEGEGHGPRSPLKTPAPKSMRVDK